MDVVREIADVYGDQDIVVLGRYPDQIAKISKAVAGKAKVESMSHDGKYLLENTYVFVGSGGTMTAYSGTTWRANCFIQRRAKRSGRFSGELPPGYKAYGIIWDRRGCRQGSRIQKCSQKG